MPRAEKGKARKVESHDSQRFQQPPERTQTPIPQHTPGNLLKARDKEDLLMEVTTAPWEQKS